MDVEELIDRSAAAAAVLFESRPVQWSGVLRYWAMGDDDDDDEEGDGGFELGR